MNNFVKYLLCLFCASLTLSANAHLTNSSLDVRHIGYADGLSSQKVFSIVEDSDGIIWIANKKGVDRYNGSELRNYPLSTISLPGMVIRLIHDPQKGLWAYDLIGNIYHYDPYNDRFEQKLSLSDIIGYDIFLTRILFDSEGDLLIGCDKGLFRQKADSSRIETLIRDEYITGLALSDQYLYAGTPNGLQCLSLDEASSPERFFEHFDIKFLYYDSLKDELWIDTVDRGLYVRHAPGSISHIKEPDREFLNPITDITRYDERHLLVGVDGGGVYTIDTETFKAELLLNTDDRSDARLHGKGVYSVMKDHNDNIWIGSYTGGASLVIPMQKPVISLSHQKGNRQSLIDNNINGIQENDNGDLWLATDMGISIRRGNDDWSHILKDKVALTFCNSHDHHMWVGTYGDGIYLIDRHGRVLRHLTSQQGILTTNYIFAIREDCSGNLWVGGMGGDLVMLEKNTLRRKTFPICKILSIEYVPHNNTLITATVNGFHVVDIASGQSTHYPILNSHNEQHASSYIITTLCNDDDTVWLATEGGGLLLYDLKSRTTRQYTTEDGLPSNDIYGLSYDTDGRMWLSTGQGIAVINDGKISNMNYISELNREYNKDSHTRLHDGRLAFGSTNGAVIITPHLITDRSYEAPLRFSKLTIDNISPETERRLRPHNYAMLQDDRKVILDHRYNSFTLSFEAINYRYQRDIVYSYILEGYEPYWSTPSDNGSVKYTNIAAGDYLFRLRSIRQSDGKILSEKSFPLEIRHPWYQTWWAWALYLLLTASIIIFAWRFKSNVLQKRYYEHKIRFFIDTAHNIRTPVSLVMAPLDDMDKDHTLTEENRYLLNLARSNISKLNNLIINLLDFEKIDIRRHDPDNEISSLNDTLLQLTDAFTPFCRQKEVDFTFTLPVEDIYIRAEAHLLEMMLSNLLSNACKYTDKGGRVHLDVVCNKHHVKIRISDTGCGIPRSMHHLIFTDVCRAENVRNHIEGSGFGLIQVYRIVRKLHGQISFQSEENRGTTFFITLKRTHERPRSATAPIPTSLRETLPVSSPAPTPRTSSQGKDLLMIIEDNSSLREYLCHLFRAEYSIVDFACGEDALKYLQTGYPDIILSDLMMPGIQGDELCRIVKQNPDTAGIPFVLLTAKAIHEAMVKGLKVGADDYITKPFNREILEVKLRGLIANRNRMREYMLHQALNQTASQATALPTEEASSSAEEFTLNPEDCKFVEQATDLVLKNMTDPQFDINTLCRETGLCRTYLYERLKSLTGKAPQEFIRIIRLRRAAELLRQGNSVADTAMMTGFGNIKYFSSLFKKEFGIQPSRYARQTDSQPR